MKLHFLGASRQVTGSMFLLEAGKYRLLIECGLIQGSPKEELRNAEPFPFDPNHIDAVILTHAHLDHSGRIPLLVERGFKGPIFTHYATRDLCEILFQDAAYINEKEAEWNNRKRMRKDLPLLKPLYDRLQARTAMKNFQPCNYKEIREIVPGVSITLYDAGHILGSSMVQVKINIKGKKRTLVFSGDLGHAGAPILHDPHTLKSADLVVMEGTYGNRLHRPWQSTWDELKGIFLSAKSRDGNILIPSFAVGRSQEILYGFARHFLDWKMDRWSLFLDSPLAIKATEIYSKYFHLYDEETLDVWRNHGHPFQLPNFHFSETAEQSMALNRFRSGAVIIAGSGMCDGGRIKHHLKHNVWRRDCQILMVGFQARGTLGRQLVDGARRIRLWGETINVNAKVHTVGGFSAHADQQGLCQWLQNFTTKPKVMLVHGESETLDILKLKLLESGFSGVNIPAYQEKLDLNSLDAYS